MHYGLNADQWYGWYFDLFSPPTGAKILEVGCGPGGMWKWGLENGRVRPTWEVTLTDLSAGMLDDAKHDLQQSRRLFTYAVADVCELPFSDGSFDFVVANYMLYHASDQRQAASEIARVLKDNGVLYAATNGARHIQEMVALQRLFAAAPDDGHPRSSSHDPFTLENGPMILSEHFAEIEVQAGDSIAEADDAERVVRFVESMDVEVNSVALRAYVQSILESRGVLSVTRSSGLLIASKLGKATS